MNIIKKINTKHKITVVITAHNNSKFIKDCILSVTQQTYLPNSIIVIDDFSADIEIIKTIINSLNQTSQINIQLIMNKKNIGPGLSRNKAWNLVKTEFVAFLDADDIFYKNKLESQIKLFKKFPKSSIIAGKKNLSSKNNSHKCDISIIKKLSFRKMLFFNTIATSSVMLKSNIKQRFDDSYYAEDYKLWLSILNKNKEIIFIDSNITTQNFNYYNKEKLSDNFLKMEIGIQKTLCSFYSNNLKINVLIFLSQMFSFFKFLSRLIRR